MGTDIDGVIESRSADGCWKVAVDLLDLQLGRDYKVWGCLFDVRGIEELRPLFADRGLPNDVSDSVRELCTDPDNDCQHNHTYATWAEVAAVDWDAPLADGPAFYYAGEWRPGTDGELVLSDIAWAASGDLIEAATDLFGGDRLLAPSEWPPGGEVCLDGAVYRPVVVTARMLAPPDDERWTRLWTAMRDLAAEHGDENVRLVVWFG
ncbi:hypothetical protein AB0B25_22085 [Nocardia sp. NPDC049190]|uniref:hypothetical protein n=1 Tax=Nocardia sp. NPDC049190 TaxID=3155650 RepID=UPI0033BFC447